MKPMIIAVIWYTAVDIVFLTKRPVRLKAVSPYLIRGFPVYNKEE